MAIQLRDHALQALLHPITLLAIVVQLLNDHVLRRVSPSPMWGKLGDVTMLVYAPVLAATLLALVIPTTDLRGRRRVGLAGVGLVGLWFTLGKTVPAVLTATNALLTTLTGRPSVLILDPTDLIALPALGLAWWVWEHPLRLKRSLGLRPFGVAALTLGWLATVATSIPTVPTGVQRVCLVDGALYAEAEFQGGSGPLDAYRSQDGGYTWTEIDGRLDQRCTIAPRAMGQEDLSVPGTPWRYRIMFGQAIERASESDVTWTRLYDSQADAASSAYAGELTVGPVNAVVEPTTGNLIVSMGRRGVLLVTPGRGPTWVSLGDYSRGFDIQRSLLFVLNYPLIIAVLLVPLAVYALWRMTANTSRSYRGYDWAATLTFALNYLLIHPAAHWPEIPAPTSPLSQIESQQVILALLAYPLAAVALDSMAKAQKRYPRLLQLNILFAGLAGAVFFLPFVLWGFTGFPEFTSTRRMFGGLSLGPILALVLTISVLFGAQLALRRTLTLETEPTNDTSRRSEP